MERHEARAPVSVAAAGPGERDLVDLRAPAVGRESGRSRHTPLHPARVRIDSGPREKKKSAPAARGAAGGAAQSIDYAREVSSEAPKRATHEDLFSVPEHMTGEIIGGVLYTQPRPASPHT